MRGATAAVLAAGAAGPCLGDDARLQRSCAAAKLKNVFAGSCNSYGWGQFNVEQCLQQIRETPLRRVELPAEQCRPGSLIPELMLDDPIGGQWQYSLPDLKALLAKDHFQVDSIDVFGYGGYAGTEELVKRRIDFAHRLGAPLIVLGCANAALHAPGDDPAKRKVRAAIDRTIRNLADYAAPKGIKIALEVHPGAAENAAAALRTLAAVDRPNVGVNFDTANILIYNRDLDATGAARQLQAVAKHVFHVHIKDVIRKSGEPRYVIPICGQGEVDFRRVFEILHAADFYGPFSFEVESQHGGAPDVRACQRDLLASMQYFKTIGEFDF